MFIIYVIRKSKKSLKFNSKFKVEPETELKTPLFYLFIYNINGSGNASHHIIIELELLSKHEYWTLFEKRDVLTHSPQMSSSIFQGKVTLLLPRWNSESPKDFVSSCCRSKKQRVRTVAPTSLRLVPSEIWTTFLSQLFLGLLSEVKGHLTVRAHLLPALSMFCKLFGWKYWWDPASSESVWQTDEMRDGIYNHYKRYLT